jgi:hypothetical protein
MAADRSTKRPYSNARRDGGDAFLPDPMGNGARGGDEESESWAEEYIASVTSADSAVMEAARNELSSDEVDGVSFESEAPDANLEYDADR